MHTINASSSFHLTRINTMNAVCEMSCRPAVIPRVPCDHIPTGARHRHADNLTSAVYADTLNICFSLLLLRLADYFHNDKSICTQHVCTVPLSGLSLSSLSLFYHIQSLYIEPQDRLLN